MNLIFVDLVCMICLSHSLWWTSTLTTAVACRPGEKNLRQYTKREAAKSSYLHYTIFLSSNQYSHRVFCLSPLVDVLL